MITIYIDGLCEPVNPGGVATYSFVVFRNGEKIYQEARVVGSGEGMSNNVAEYAALVSALKWLAKKGWQDEEIKFFSDSQLLVNQMSGLWECHGGYYEKTRLEALELLNDFPRVEFKWIPREENAIADELSRRAYEEWCVLNRQPVKYHDQREKTSVPTDRGCWVCKWGRVTGPHIGCFYGGKYHGWIQKKEAWRGCRNFESR